MINLGRNDPPYVTMSQSLQGNPGIRAEDLEERLEILKGEYEAAETSEGFFSPFAVLSLDVRVVEKKPGVRRGAWFEPRQGQPFLRCIH